MTLSQVQGTDPEAAGALAHVGLPGGDGCAQVLSAVAEAHRILVVSHARPDGDSIGSTLACGLVLAELGKHATMVSADRVPKLYLWLPGVERILHAERVEGDFDLVIVLECDGLDRTGLAGLGRYLTAGRVINIDHHASGHRFAAVNWIDPTASAVAEMVFDLARAAGVPISPAMATCLYAGVLTDTGSFSFSGMKERTLRLAADLVRLGAGPARVAQQIYFSNPLSKMKLLGAALSNLDRQGRVAWLWIAHEDMRRAEACEEDCEGIVNYAIALAGVELAAFLQELPDGMVRLSLRSQGDIDVAKVAEEFGGGGHVNASGCTLPGPLPKATEEIVSLLRGLT